MAAIAIKALLTRLNSDQQNALYDLVNTWLTAEKVPPLFLKASIWLKRDLIFLQHSRPGLFFLRPACGGSALKSAACLWRWSRRTLAAALKVCCHYWRRRQTQTTMKMCVHFCAPYCPLPPCGTALTVNVFVWQIAEEEEEKGADRLLFTFLTLISKLCKHCSMLELGQPQDTLCKIWGK